VHYEDESVSVFLGMLAFSGLYGRRTQLCPLPAIGAKLRFVGQFSTAKEQTCSLRAIARMAGAASGQPAEALLVGQTL
jgi:hypothetical protein